MGEERKRYQDLDSPALRAAAKRQFGFVTREQLKAAGFTKRLLGKAKREGLIAEAMPGVFRLAFVSGAFRAALTKAVLSLPTTACASHEAAGILHQLDGIGSAQPEFIAPHGLGERPGVRLHRTRLPLEPDERSEVDGFAVTSVKRTLFDLAGRLSWLEFLMAMDCALRRELVTLEELRTYFASKRPTRHRGKVQFARALADCEARGRPFRSALEVRWWVVSVEAGLPVPLLEPRIVDEDGELFPDFLYPWQYAIIETKGHKDHGESWALEKDARRELRLASLAYPVISITWQMLEEDTPSVVARVRLAFEALMAQPRMAIDPARRFRRPGQWGATRECSRMPASEARRA